MKYLIAFLLILGFSICGHSQKNKPKVVVGIVVDQMCYEYLYRFQDNYSKKGFKEIMKNGTNCRNVEYNYIPTYTGPGHASIYAGTTPNNHGIIANAWFERKTNGLVNCVGDNSVHSVGASSIYGNCSPHRLKSYTVTDQLKMTYPQSKVVSISIKDRGAILPGGHKSDGSYWFDYQTGKFITSSYFKNTLPPWLIDFNNNKNCYTYAKTWSPLLELDKYISTDESNYEVVIPGKINARFPYEIKKLMSIGNNLQAFTISPFANTLLTDLAIEAMQNEHLGETKNTDMICISYSSTDIAGHAFGPYSMEIEDMYIRLDLEIAKLLKFLNKTYGKNGYVLFMTADHGVVPVPQQLIDEKLPGGYLYVDSLLAELKNESVKFFNADLIDNIINLNLYLNHERIDSIKGLNVNDVTDFFKNIILLKKSVKNVVLGKDLTEHLINEDKWVRLIRKGFDKKRSGDLIIMLEPGYLPEKLDLSPNQGTSHGSGYSYDTHVPLLWYGAGIKKQDLFYPISITDIAPTLTHFLYLQRTGAMTGEPIIEVLNK